MFLHFILLSSCLRDVVAPSVELDQAATHSASAPSLVSGESQRHLKVGVCWAVTIVGRRLTSDASLLLAGWAGSDVAGDVSLSDEDGANCV
jgi:hypothetical protein